MYVSLSYMHVLPLWPSWAKWFIFSRAFTERFMLGGSSTGQAVLGRCFRCSEAAPPGSLPRRERLGDGWRCELCRAVDDALRALRVLDRESIAIEHCLSLIRVATSYAQLRTVGVDGEHFTFDPASADERQPEP